MLLCFRWQIVNYLFINWNIKLGKLAWFVSWKQIPSTLPWGVGATPVADNAGSILQGGGKDAVLEIAAVTINGFFFFNFAVLGL